MTWSTAATSVRTSVRGIAASRSDDAVEAVPTDAIPVVSLAEWLDRDPGELVEEFDRLYVPKNDGRWLRRNALIAAGNVGGAALRPSIEREVASEDPVLADAASWALARMGERGAA